MKVKLLSGIFGKFRKTFTGKTWFLRRFVLFLFNINSAIMRNRTGDENSRKKKLFYKPDRARVNHVRFMDCRATVCYPCGWRARSPLYPSPSAKRNCARNTRWGRSEMPLWYSVFLCCSCEPGFYPAFLCLHFCCCAFLCRSSFLFPGKSTEQMKEQKNGSRQRRKWIWSR